MLPAIPLIDARSDALTTADPAAVRALPLADRVARRWLARSRSPYLAELDAIAAHTRTAGTYAINLSYEYGCTTLARAVLRRRCAVPLIGRSGVSAAPSSWRTAVDRPRVLRRDMARGSRHPDGSRARTVRGCDQSGPTLPTQPGRDPANSRLHPQPCVDAVS